MLLGFVVNIMNSITHVFCSLQNNKYKLTIIKTVTNKLYDYFTKVKAKNPVYEKLYYIIKQTYMFYFKKPTKLV